MKIKSIISLVFIFMLIFILASCNKAAESGIIIEYSGNEKLEAALNVAFPDEEIYHYYHEPLSSIQNRALAVEVYYSEYEHLQEMGYYIYPIYIQTPIIAINRDLTDVNLNSWSDLRDYEGMVKFYDENRYASMAIGFDEESKSINKKYIIDVLKNKCNKGTLQFIKNYASHEDEYPEVMVIYDHSTANINKIDGNIEIIIPTDSTLSFTKALLSKVDISDHLDTLKLELLSQGFRTADGDFSEELYGNLNYDNVQNSELILDLTSEYDKMNGIINMDIGTGFILSNRNFADNILRYLILLVVVSLWGMYSYFRLTKREFRIYILLISIFSIIWIVARLVRYLAINTGAMYRYSWYFYYIGLIYIPMVSMWIALSVEKATEKKKLDAFKKYSFIVATILLLLVLTNDLHNLTFNITYLSNRNFSYTFGIFMIPILCWEFGGMVIPMFILLRKAYKMPDKKMMIPPIMSITTLVLYFFVFNIVLNNRVSTELTRTVVIIVVINIELCMQFGLIPMNKKYVRIFEEINMSMEIKDFDENIIFKSKEVPKEGEYLHMIKSINGGTVGWMEDLREINILSRSLEESTNELEKKNADLKNKYIIEKKIESIQSKSNLAQSVEMAIQSELEEIDDNIKNTKTLNSEDKKKVLKLMGFKIAKLKQKSNTLLVSLIENELSVENIMLVCRTIATTAKSLELNVDIFGTGEGHMDFESANVICSWLSNTLEKLAFTGSEIVGNYTVRNRKLRMTLFTDNLEIGTNKFTAENKVQGDLSEVAYKIVATEDDEGYRGILEIEVNKS